MPLQPSSELSATARAQGRLLLRAAGQFCGDDARQFGLEAKDALLLAYLAVEGPASRARLAALLWPEVDEERARGNLRQRLLRLRRAVGFDLVVGSQEARLAEGVDHDLDEGHELLRDLDPGQAGGGMGDWLAAQRERRRRARGDELARAAASAEAAGDLATSLDHAKALVELDPLSEDAHRRAIRLHYLRGDVGAALAAYRHCAELLRAEFGAEPGRETQQLWRQIQQAAPAARPPAARQPVQVTILRPPRLIGRRQELAALAQAWVAGQAFLLLGEAGMGKSRLLAELAREGGRLVLTQARPGDAGVPYATLARLLRSVIAGAPVALAAGARGHLARVLPELQPVTAAPLDGRRLQLQEAIEAVLLDARSSGVQGILLDDLHFADEASVDMLRTILGGERNLELRWGFAQRSGEPTTATLALRGTLEEAMELSAVALTPLDAQQMAELVDSLGLPEIDGSAIAERLVRHTGGNPMFALETLKHAAAAGSASERLPRPASVGALIERRLRQLSAPAIALARVAAVAGVDFSIDMAEHVLKTPALALADAWNELEAAQVLRGAAFAHDLVFEAALRSIPEAIATHTHASIAEWLERSGGEPARIAAHWEATATPQRALPWLHKAAELAHAAMRAREAVDFLARAAEIEAETASPEQAFTTLTTIVDRRFSVDRDASMLSLIDRLDQLAANTLQQIEALLLRADFGMHLLGSVDEGLAAAERAVELATAAGEDRFRVGGTLTAAILQAERADYAAAARRVDELLPEIRRWPAGEDRCNLLAKAGFVLVRAGRTAQAVQLFDESAGHAKACRYWSTEVIALANAAQALLRLHRPADALDRLARSDALRAAHDQLEGSGSSNDWMAALALRLLGRYGEALQRAQSAIETMRVRSPGNVSGAVVARANAWLDLGQVARTLQDRELALRCLARPVQQREIVLLDLRLAAEARIRADDAVARGRTLLQEPLQHFMELVVRLQVSRFETAGEALAGLRPIVASARQAGFRGLEAAALSRAALAELQAGDADSAVTHARLAVELAAGQNTEDLSWPAIVHNAAVVLQRAGLVAEARELVARGAACLRDVAERQVPPEFRDSFLNRNPANRELLTLATRLK